MALDSGLRMRFLPEVSINKISCVFYDTVMTQKNFPLFWNEVLNTVMFFKVFILIVFGNVSQGFKIPNARRRIRVCFALAYGRKGWLLDFGYETLNWSL